MISNFDIHYVWDHSSENVNWTLKFAGVWAGQEGSLLLWVWIIIISLAIEEIIQFYRSRKKNQDLDLYLSDDEYLDDEDFNDYQDNEYSDPSSITTYDWTRVIVMLVVLVFMILLVVKDPFVATHVAELTNAQGDKFTLDPKDYPGGHGLNPMLRNFWMVIHPPLLLIGYALITIPFAAALAYSINNDRKWSKISIQWSRWAWLFLTLGLGIGALWAYVALGWGGYWAWDPVEVGGLVPWITLSAFMHTQLMNKRKNQYKIITPILGTVTFLLVLFATFITRSGLWASVHSWSETEIGQILVGTMIFTIVASGLIILRSYIIRTRLQPDYEYFSQDQLNWDSLSMIITIIIFTILTVLTFIGLIVTMGKPSPQFYETRLGPFVVILMVALAICLTWRYFGKENTIYILAWTSLAAVACAFILPMYIFPGTDRDFYSSYISAHTMVGFMVPFAVLAIFASLYKLVKQITRKSIRNSLRRISPHIIHLGIAFIIIAYAMSQTMSVQEEKSLDIGDSLKVGDYSITLKEIEIQEDTGDLDSEEYWDTWYITCEIYKNDEFVSEGKINIVYGYKYVKDNDKTHDIRLFIFGLNTVYLNNLNIGPVDNTIREAFEQHSIFLSDDAVVEHVDTGEIHYRNVYDQNGKPIRITFINTHVKINNDGNIFLIENVGSQLNVYGRRDYSNIKTSDVYVGEMLFEDVYINTFAIDHNSAYMEAQTIPMMSFLWGGMYLFMIGIIIRIFIDYLPVKRLPPNKILEDELKKFRG
jgi:cytochrome c-type biogenesis protein CcmF